MHDALAHDPAKDELLILVDGLDRQLGEASKARAHTEGLLHRAFSVVLWREGEAGREILIAQRAAHKYHCGGLWANSCCSHPRAGEELLEAARRRVLDELGVTVGELREIGSFVYRASFASALFEYEYDHVLLAEYSGELAPNPDEVSAVRWVSLDELAGLFVSSPKLFAPWAFTVLSMAMKCVTNP